MAGTTETNSGAVKIKSMSVTMPERMSVPNLSAWLRQSSISSVPEIPSG